MKKGFTLVELVIVIAIVIVLSVVSVPIYRSYVDKAKYAEGYALMGTILSAQKAYYSEYGYFYKSDSNDSTSGFDTAKTSFDSVLGIDARGNKYFSIFSLGYADSSGTFFVAAIKKPDDLISDNKTLLRMKYTIDKGLTTDSRVSNFVL